MQNITLKMSTGQASLIREALGGQPYRREYELMLQHHAQAQLSPETGPPAQAVPAPTLAS